ncbi:MAG: S8 family serine peptidase, partial [candidate division Zixibacteria bacterium]|nr:S8 family serine peptidase [candidate division Zixibacteria bacterium]
SRPWVTNLSLGGQQGPHDGRSAEDSAIDNLVGSGNPRKVVVAAAGNDGERRLHSSGTLNANSAVSVSKSFTVTTAGSVVGIDLWTQISPNIPTLLSTRVTGPDTLFEVSGSGGSANHTDGDISIFSSPFSNTDVNTSVTITIKKTGTWTISLKGARGSGTGNFDMWIYSGNASWTPPDGDFSRLVGTPGSAKNAITVGAYVSKASWIDQNNAGHTATANGVAVVPGNVASFTSPGPTRDGRQKPEISAPGQVIASSFSSDATPGNGLSIFGTGSILVGGKQAIAQGTSMAAPHVVGAVALVLEEAAKRASNLDAIQIRSLMQATARADAATGTVPNAQWGSGKMNVDSLFFVIFGDPLPNAITLTSFAAETDGRRVALAWHISNPSNHAGFHVYRATTAYPEDRIRITPALIIGGPHLSYDDTPPTPGTYHYWLADVDITGHSTFHGPVTMVFTGLPAVFRLGQSRPNPFNPSTLIEYDLPRQTHVSLTVYNILGQEVARLVDGVRQAGRHTVTWNGRNAQGQPASSGVYLYRLTDIAGFVESRRMLLLK